ncbi:MAG: hypothetical protein NXI31_11325 [bacterium]|nr:hypothetical protein [bacterium]
MRSIHFRFVLGLALAALLGFALPAQTVAWAWLAPTAAANSFTPDADWQFNSAGGTITATRFGATQNRFAVTFPGAAPADGIVLASAYSGFHTITVDSWSAVGSDVRAIVSCFLPNGAPADNAPFTIQYRRRGHPFGRQAHLWANSPTSASYTPNLAYNWNGTTSPSTISRSGPGVYVVRVPVLGNFASSKRGHVQVSPYGSTPYRAKVSSWGPSGSDLFITVRTHDLAGNPADARFTLHYCEQAAPINPKIGSGAFVWANLASGPSYAPNPVFTDGNGALAPRGGQRVEWIHTGYYRVRLPGLPPAGSSNALVTAYGSGSHYATIDGWVDDGRGGTEVYVNTWDGSGTPANALFNLLYLTSKPTDDAAWAWINPLNQPNTFQPSPSFSYTPNDEPITVQRDPAAANRFLVTFPFDSALGMPHVSPYSGNHAAVVSLVGYSYDSARMSLQVDLYDAAGGPAADAPFTVHVRRNGDLESRHAYLRANQPTATGAYLPSAPVWNGNRPSPSVLRLARGHYRITLPGLGGSSTELGNVQVTPESTTMRRARVESWTVVGNDVQVRVRCSDVTGAPADSIFLLSYAERAAAIAPRLGSGAHVLADQPLTTSYAPNVAYTDNNSRNGPFNGERVTRLAPGVYNVHLPNLTPSDSSNVIVTALASNGDYATVSSWSTDGGSGTFVYVTTFRADGAVDDVAFSLQYVTDEAALTQLALTDPYGLACNGPTMSSVNRPLLGSMWDLTLSNLPPSSTIAFLQFGLGQRSLPISPLAPGCRQYTSGDAVVLLLLPVPSPAYSIAIPAHPSFVGLQLWTQGGALAPVNALGIAVSNGYVGVIGDL